MTTDVAPTTTSVHKFNRHEFLAEHFGLLSISAVFVVLFIFFSIQNPDFATGENLVNILRQVAPTVIVAVGMTFVITTGAIDLSVGSIVGLSAAALGIYAATGNALLALLFTLVFAAAVGFFNGYLSAYGPLPSFIVTLATFTAVRGIALLVTDGYSTPINSPIIVPLGQGALAGIYTPTWIALGVAVLGWYVFTQTRFGRYTQAVGSNAESLRRAGVNIRRIQASVLVMTGLLAGLAGILTAARLGSGSSNSGVGFELEVITAVVLGGTALTGGRGSIWGSVVGALTLGIISNGLVLLGVNVYWVPIFQGAILAIAILVNTKLITKVIGRR